MVEVMNEKKLKLQQQLCEILAELEQLKNEFKEKRVPAKLTGTRFFIALRERFLKPSFFAGATACATALAGTQHFNFPISPPREINSRGENKGNNDNFFNHKIKTVNQLGK